MENKSHIPVEKLPDWMNAVGILLSNLPHVFWIGLHNRIEQVNTIHKRSPMVTKGLRLSTPVTRDQ